MSRTQRMGILYMVAAVMGYAFFPVFTKTLLEQGMRPLDIGFMRFVIAVTIFWGIKLSVSARTQRPPDPRRLPLIPILALGVMLAIAALTGFFGLERLPSATYIVLFYTYPMMTAIIEAVLGQPLPRVAWLALALTLVGVVLTAPDFSQGLQGDNLPGVLIAFVNALAVAIYYVISSRALRGTTDMITASATILTVTLGVMILVVLVVGVQLPPNALSWAVITTFAVVGTVIPVFMVNRGIQLLGAAQAGILGSVEPLLASILAMIILGEVMTGNQWLGGLVIVAGIVVLELPALINRRAAQSALDNEAIGNPY